MPPPRKEICDCGILEQASREPVHPIRYDEKMNEYFIAYGNQGKLCIYYCPFCGGLMPESRRSSLFEFISQDEKTRLSGLFKKVATEADVLNQFGSPDRETSARISVILPEKDGKPQRGKALRTLTYLNLSPTAEVWFEIAADGRVGGGWAAKPKAKGNEVG